MAGEQIANEEVFASRGFVSSVFIVEKVHGSAFSHGNDSGVLDENPVEKGTAQGNDGTGISLAKNTSNDADQESGRCRSLALVKSLAAHGATLEGSQVHRNLVEGGVSFDDRLKKSEQEILSG